MKKVLLITAVIFLAVSCNRKPTAVSTPINLSPAYNYSRQLQIGSQTLMVEIAGTPQAEAQGLSGRTSMENSQGMLFNFGSDAAVDPAFWMPDMKFNLDMIWIYKNKVIGITADVPAPASSTTPDSTLPLFYPPSPVNWVVEVNAGWAEKNNIAVGDAVTLNN